MTEDLLRRGTECEAAGDLDGAAAAYKAADEQGDPEGAILLGLVLKRLGQTRPAIEAFQRADSRGHPEGGTCLGNLLSDLGDTDGAKAAYTRSIAAGSADALLNLGLMLADGGATADALPYLRTAHENGDASASWAVGKILEDQGDLAASAEAYRRGAGRGNAQAAFGLGAVLMKLNDRNGAQAAFQHADALGHEQAKAVLALFSAEQQQDVAKRAKTSGYWAEWAKAYGDACLEVLSASDACLEVANRAVGARQMAEERPQHEASVRSFTEFAENAEGEFQEIYEEFESACDYTRQVASDWLAAVSDPFVAEAALEDNLEPEVTAAVGATKAFLLAHFGASPAAFLAGISEANALIGQVADGRLYRSSERADSRTCPWCAETIKATAIVCRYCGRDL